MQKYTPHSNPYSFEPAENKNIPAAVSDGRYVFVSQLLPRQPDGTIPTGINRQMQQVLQNLFQVLFAAGTKPEALLQLTLTVSDSRAVPAAQKIYEQEMSASGPALCWRFGRLPGALVAADAIALAGEREETVHTVHL